MTTKQNQLGLSSVSQQVQQKPDTDSFNIEQQNQQQYYALPYFCIDYQNIECEHPEQLINEEPNNNKDYKKYQSLQKCRFGLNISNCELVDSNGLTQLCQKLFKINHLVSLNLSCNKMVHIQGVELLINLKILQLHGNELEDLDTLKPIYQLKQLQQLTVHGNPLSLIINYRQYLVNKISTLKNLDFSLINNNERSWSAAMDVERFQQIKRENVILQKIKTKGQLQEYARQQKEEQEAQKLKKEAESKKKQALQEIERAKKIAKEK